MKNITLSLSAFLFLVISGHSQQLDHSNTLRSHTMKNEVNVIDTSNFNEDVDDILKISITNKSTSASASGDGLFAVNNTPTFSVSNYGELNFNAAPVTVNLSSGSAPSLTTNVSYTALQRVWRIEEVSENAPTASIKIPTNSFTYDDYGNYYMFISNSGIFDSTTDHKLMTLDESGNLETEYNFHGTSFITFGFAPKVTEARSIYFNGSTDYIDMQNKLDLNPSGFTISAWIKSNVANTSEVSILSKRDAAFKEGYDLTLTDDNKIGIYWENSNMQSLKSYASIPNNTWHHVAVSYNGSMVSIYIDGVLDHSAIRKTPLANKASFLVAAAGADAPSQHFNGHIDEVRIWDTNLTQAQLRFIMNQEITNNSGQVMGKVLPTTITKNDIGEIPWSDLAGYYPISEFTYKNTLDASGNGNDGQLKNVMTVAEQSAPLPFRSQQDGNWNSSASWANGRVQSIPGSASIVDPNITMDWNIVKIAHNLTLDNSALPTLDNNRTLLGLIVEANQLTLQGNTENQTGNGITITHYLELAGKIDLEGESQLIQTADSDLNVLSNGSIERDQQGTSDLFTYNYWSSPVTKENATYNSFKITDVMKDGTTASNALPINFSSSGYDGAPTSPIRIADYWIWKYANQASQDGSSWQHIRRTGTILPGEGFTMKGPGTGSIEIQQNYVFSGKPNNGNISVTLAPNNEYLVGNPYPSAIDANIFIRDNGPEMLNNNTPNPNSTPLISGTLYFWKHWGGESHMQQNYKGGYAIYNYSGGVAAASKGINISGSVAEELSGQKAGRYIPVGQGFFITGDGGGTINFNNRQRVFKKEGSGSSLFMRDGTTENASGENDDRMKFRIGFNSVNSTHRQLLLTIDENASSDVDWAYDGKMNENQTEDMFWIINDEEYVIQGSNEAETTSTYPLGIQTDSDGLNTITIDDLESVPSDFNIYVHDMDLELYHDLRASDYEFFLNAGSYLNRFEITFGTDDEALGINEDIQDSMVVLYSNDLDKIVLINPNQINVKSITLYNLLGQPVCTLKDIVKNGHSEYEVSNLSSGAYVIKLLTASNAVMTKKVIVN